MKYRRTGTLLLLPILALAAPRVTAMPQTRPAGSHNLVISGDISRPLTVSPADLAAYPRTSLVVPAEGREIKYEGVLVSELLQRAGAPVGRTLEGKALATYVLATARDGYQVLFSIAELDAALTGSQVIVADRMDGQPLNESLGPLRLVAPRDTHASRSVRMLQRLDIVRLQK